MENSYHKATKHSYWSVRQNHHHIDWSTQPSPFKIYPEKFPLIPLDLNNPTHQFIYLLGGINAKKSYPGVEYYLRIIPSAGALYPVEIYLQTRGVEGFRDGIYHFSPAQLALRLLYPLKEDEGVEAYFEDNRAIEGFLVLYSALYYRSSWKYRSRAFRYCLLDTGHALGALEMSSFWYGYGYHIRYRFDKMALNRHFGFKNREFFLSSGVVGIPKQKRVKSFTMELEYVDGTRFFNQDPLIEKAYLETLPLFRCKRSSRYPKFNFVKERLKEAIMERRSIRSFRKKAIKKEIFEAILNILNQPIPSDCDEELHLYYVVNRVEGLKKGLYKDGELLKEGDFSELAGYLCLEQALGSESAVTFFLTSSGKNYQPLYQKAGHIGHRAYIAATYFGLGCSGIGAYYDDEVRSFLKTSDMILYALAIGE